MTRLCPIVCLLCAALAAPLVAQDPAPVPAPETTPPPAEATEAPPTDNPQPRRRRRPVVVIEAGTVHPVAGPAIEDGVVVIRGDRIVALGRRGEVAVPPNATVRSFPTGHVYPGLVDAASDAFTDTAVRTDGSSDAADALADVLARRGDREDELARAGITTAYVAAASPALVRGQGAIVRPLREGFETWQGHERAALGLRLTGGPDSPHALQRQPQLQAAVDLFDGLDEFRKARTDHDEALQKYQKEFTEYLDWHRKKNGKDEPKKEGEGDAKTAPPAEAKPDAPKPDEAPREGGRRRRGGQPPREDGGGGAAEPASAPTVVDALLALAQDPPKQDPPKPDPAKQDPPKQDPPAADAKPAAKDEKKDEAPKRPTWPKAPPKDPAKEALLRVVDGELPLRVEAHRPDELRAALRLWDERQIPVMVLERAYGAAGMANAIAERGIGVVLTDVWPGSLPEAYEAFDPVALPARLHAAGVPVAIATGSARRADQLRLMAACAVAGGLPADAALRAITLTPAELLGIAADTGSLAVGKFGDVLVCDRPLLQSDARVLLVLAKGRPEFEAN